MAGVQSREIAKMLTRWFSCRQASSSWPGMDVVGERAAVAAHMVQVERRGGEFAEPWSRPPPIPQRPRYPDPQLYESVSQHSRREVPTTEYILAVLIQTLSVGEAREQLPSVLERFRNGDRTSVGEGSHRKTEAVMFPVEVFDELTSERARSLTQAVASLRAEGIAVGTDVEAITERWARGEISTAQMRESVRRLYGARSPAVSRTGRRWTRR
jgi:hypothetical protein